MDATSFNFPTFYHISLSVHVVMGTNQKPLKMLNRNDLIKKCFEAYRNFKGICNQNIFPNYSRNGMCEDEFASVGTSMCDKLYIYPANVYIAMQCDLQLSHCV